MNTEKRISFLEWLLIIGVMLLLVESIAQASGDDIRQSNDNNILEGSIEVNPTLTSNPSLTSNPVLNAGDNVGGDIDIQGDKNRAYAFGNSMGDVDVGPCYGSKQWNTPVYGRQGYTMLLVQCAERLDALGLHLAAALMRCSDNTYAGLFVSRTECLQLSTIPEDVSVPMPATEDYHEKHEAEAQQIVAQIGALTATVSALEDDNAELESQVREAEKTAQRAYNQPQAVSDEVQKRVDDYDRRVQAMIDYLEDEE